MLASHVHAEEVVHRLYNVQMGPSIHDHHTSRSTRPGGDPNSGSHNTPYSSRYTSLNAIPKHVLPAEGCPADTTYQMIKDELDLDERPSLNLASFVSTWLEPNARALLAENAVKNLADADEYPAMMAIHDRCVSILADMWGVSKDSGEHAVGSATTGSSEAIHLGGLAMKRRWQERRRKEGKSTERPNILMGANAQVALEKFARYFEVESRILPVSSKSQFRLDPELVRENIDDNTIGIYVILGSTMTGHYEPVEEISNILDEYQAKTGIDIPIHVDAASGGFIAPFTHCGAGGARWNFELPRVKSINTSGHKYGLVSAGVGWVIWRDESYLPESLVFTLDYLGGQEKSYTLNFSRPGAQVIVQYYNLIHLGFAGYREIMENCLRNARLLANSLERTPWFTVVSDIHRRVPEAPSVKKSDKEGATNTEGNETNNGYVLAAENGSPADTLSSLVDNLKTKATETTNTVTSKFPDSISDDTSANYTPGLPIVAFRLADSFKKDYPHIQQSTIIFMLRVKHWIIPNYKLPPNEQETEIMRVVVRENMTYDIMDRLLSDLHDVMETLMQRDEVDLSMLQNKKKKKKEMQKKGKDGGGKSKVEKFEERVEEADRRIDENLHKTVC